MKKFMLFVLVVAFTLSVFAGGGILGVTENLEADKEYKIAVILKTLANDFWVEMKNGIKDEAARLGIKVDIYAVSNEGDIQGQLSLMETILNRGYDGLAVAPITPTNLIPGIVRATKMGIPVVNLDESVDRDSLYRAGGALAGFVNTNNFNVGKQAAEFVAEKINGRGQVAVIEGMAGNKSGEDRKNGFIEGIKPFSSIELVSSQPANWDRMMAVNVATNMIQRYPNLKAIYCANDTMALGAVQAVANANKLGKIIVVGTDGVSEAIQSVQAGRLSATIAQDPYNIGVAGLRMVVFALNALDGEVPSKLVK
jgi:D-allose transport system substrate-binding protein